MQKKLTTERKPDREMRLFWLPMSTLEMLRLGRPIRLVVSYNFLLCTSLCPAWRDYQITGQGCIYYYVYLEQSDFTCVTYKSNRLLFTI